MSFAKTAELLARELSCSVCLQLFSEPVTLPCGHNYCLSCIQKAMGVDKDRHYCPECRAEYVGGEDLQRNPKLNNIVEGYKAAARTGAGIRVSVMCDHCLGIGTPAVTTCLKCEISLCPQHLQRHAAKESFRSHPLVEPPMPDLGFRSCVVHNKRLEYFCVSDGAFLCSSCFIEGSHLDHDIQTFESAGAELRRILDTQTRSVRDKLQMVDCLLLRATEDTRTFTATGGRLEATAMTLLSGMEDLVRNFRSCLSQQLVEEQGASQATRQASIDKMTGLHSALKEVQEQAKCILLQPDECLFVHQFLWLKPRVAEALDTAVDMPAPAVLNERRLSVSARTDDFKTEMIRLVQDLHNLLNPLELMFNPNTAHPSLVLSKDLRTVKYSATKQAYPEHPERFLTVPQVLCSQGFSGGEHVWVVEVGNCLWSLGVCYSHIPRKGDQSRLGHNQLSWRLQWKNKKLTACHASSHVTLPETTPLLRVEVSLDYEGGRLSFHSLVGHRVHLHTFRTIFREMVYPAFCVHSTSPESWITIQS